MKQAARQGGMGEAINHRHQRAVDLDRVVLLGQWPEVGQVIGRIIDAAHEGRAVVDHNDLAVQAPQRVGPQAKGTRPRI